MSGLSQKEIQEIVEDIVESLPMRDLVSFAKMDETDLQVIKQVFELYLRRKLGKDGYEDELPEIMEALWKKIRETHRIRVVR